MDRKSSKASKAAALAALKAAREGGVSGLATLAVCGSRHHIHNGVQNIPYIHMALAALC